MVDSFYGMIGRAVVRAMAGWLWENATLGTAQRRYPAGAKKDPTCAVGT